MGSINYPHQVYLVSKPSSLVDSTIQALPTVVISANALHPLTPSTPSGTPTDVFNLNNLNNLNNAQPRLLHPKKRKFDYAEMEEIDQQTTCLALDPTQQSQTIIYQQPKDQNGSSSVSDSFEVATSSYLQSSHNEITISDNLDKLDKRSHSSTGDSQENVRLQHVSAKKGFAINYR